MKNIGSLIALLVSVLLVSGCGDDSANQTSASTSTAPQEVAAPATDDLPWSSLNATQKSVLSVGEVVWPKIPVEKRREMLAVADRWNQTAADEQYKMMNELRDYAGMPHIGPNAKK